MVHPKAGHLLEEAQYLLAFPPAVDHHGDGPQVHAVGGLEQQVRRDPVQLAHEHPDPGGAWRYVQLQELLNGHGEGQLREERCRVVHAGDVGGALQVGEVLGGLLHAGVQVADDRLAPQDRLALHLQHQPEHPVGGRVGWPHVEDHPLVGDVAGRRIVGTTGQHRCLGLADAQHGAGLVAAVHALGRTQIRPARTHGAGRLLCHVAHRAEGASLNWTGIRPMDTSRRSGWPSQSSGMRIRVWSGWPLKETPSRSQASRSMASVPG